MYEKKEVGVRRTVDAAVRGAAHAASLMLAWTLLRQDNCRAQFELYRSRVISMLQEGAARIIRPGHTTGVQAGCSSVELFKGKQGVAVC